MTALLYFVGVLLGVVLFVLGVLCTREGRGHGERCCGICVLLLGALMISAALEWLMGGAA